MQRGKCGLTFSPGWPFPPWGDHMQHGVQGRERITILGTPQQQSLGKRGNDLSCSQHGVTGSLELPDIASRVNSHPVTPWSMQSSPFRPGDKLESALQAVRRPGFKSKFCYASLTSSLINKAV